MISAMKHLDRGWLWLPSASLLHAVSVSTMERSAYWTERYDSFGG
jgi:hypothetical protein